MTLVRLSPQLAPPHRPTYLGLCNPHHFLMGVFSYLCRNIIQMAECINNIVTANFGCDAPIEPTSGYDLGQAPELSQLTLADTANEKYVTGAKLAQEKLKFAITDVKNDLLGAMSSNKMLPSLTDNITYQTCDYSNKTLKYPSNGQERGFTLYMAKKERLKRLKITNLYVLPINDVAGAEINIYDAGQMATYTTDLKGGELNVIPIDYVILGDYIRILADLNVYSTRLICQVGCNGATPNPCGYTKGFNGQSEIGGKEGFGLGCEFSCFCDYEQLMCDLSRQYLGKIIWLKARLLLLDEMRFTDRMNNWTIYNNEDIEQLRGEVAKEYTDTWNTFIEVLPKLLKTYKGDCFSCTGSKWMQNI